MKWEISIDELFTRELDRWEELLRVNTMCHKRIYKKKDLVACK